ncbi:hypothetical protein [Thalassovita sp.]|uniref:hypothetical protein n=1 Tax=Thalassovita sp. TaxID=1979401 RepID=UPI002B275839|nr:hypothetical protein [Thalassovita sp.]
MSRVSSASYRSKIVQVPGHSILFTVTGDMAGISLPEAVRATFEIQRRLRPVAVVGKIICAILFGNCIIIPVSPASRQAMVSIETDLFLRSTVCYRPMMR